MAIISDALLTVTSEKLGLLTPEVTSMLARYKVTTISRSARAATSE